jgi:hypothetical protein
MYACYAVRGFVSHWASGSPVSCADAPRCNHISKLQSWFAGLGQAQEPVCIQALVRRALL